MNITAEITTRLADDLARKKNQLIIESAAKFLGIELSYTDDMVLRCQRIRLGEGDQFYIDGVPILWVGDTRLEQDGTVMTANFNYLKMKG